MSGRFLLRRKKNPSKLGCMGRIHSLFLGLLVLSFSVQAEMYKWVDENGEVVYSDEPPHEGAKPLDPPKITTTPAIKYTPPKPKAEKNPEETEKKTQTRYERFEITSPPHDQPLRNNPGNVTISFALEPGLDTANGHYINLKVDGKARDDKLQSMSVTIPHMDRGTHQLQAEIRNAEGKVIKTSNSVTFHLLRHSRLFNKPAP